MKKLLKWLRAPHGWGLFIVYPLAVLLIAGAILCVTFSPEGEFFAYLSYLLYLLSAVALGYTVYTIVYFVRVGVRAGAKKHALLGRFVNDFEFRTLVFAVVSFCVTLCYAAFDGLIAALEVSVWYAGLAVYYGLLALMRGGVLINHRYTQKYVLIEEERRKKDASVYRFCGIFLILLTLALSGAIMQMVRQNRLFSYAGTSIYAAALYAMVKIVMAVVNLFKAKKRENLTVQAFRSISFSEALVSILALQTAMLAILNEGDTGNAVSNSFLGAAVSIIIIVMGVFMIRKGNRILKYGGEGEEKINREEAEEQDET